MRYRIPPPAPPLPAGAAQKVARLAKLPRHKAGRGMRSWLHSKGIKGRKLNRVLTASPLPLLVDDDADDEPDDDTLGAMVTEAVERKGTIRAMLEGLDADDDDETPGGGIAGAARRARRLQGGPGRGLELDFSSIRLVQSFAGSGAGSADPGTLEWSFDGVTVPSGGRLFLSNIASGAGITKIKRVRANDGANQVHANGIHPNPALLDELYETGAVVELFPGIEVKSDDGSKITKMDIDLVMADRAKTFDLYVVYPKGHPATRH